MIQRYDVGGGVCFSKGRYVLYEEHLAELFSETSSLKQNISFLREELAEAKKETANLKAEIQTLIEKAANFIGTEKSLWSIGCIEAALHHAEWLRSEWESGLNKIAELELKIVKLKEQP
jgi:predicted RNase H-like nuclease (RuvC/YqgF family)